MSVAENCERGLSLWEMLKEDYAVHHKDWSRPGFRAIAVYRFGHWRLGVRSRLLRGLMGIFYWRLFRFVRNVYGIEIAATVQIGRRLEIAHQGAIVVHAFATIGDDCVIRQGVTLGVGGLNREGDFAQSGPVIGDRVDFGAGCKVVGKVVIGDDVNIAPNAVVLTNVPMNSSVLPPMAKILPRPNVRDQETPKRTS